jgi:TonB-linked SusC/RagA family outer membrane protein
MERNYLICFILFVASLFLGGAHAQTTSSRTVQGVVNDAQGDPLIGVSVTEITTGNGTVTDGEGQFRLSFAAGANARLQFRYIGYKPVEVDVDARSVYTIVMSEDVSALDEVVVVAYGTQRKKEITGAISVVDVRQMEKMTLSGVGQALQGLATGVRVTTNGVPGSGADIIVRGIGSFNSVSPLYVIDGMILESSQREFNMNDVESVQVLKDASATALYGARGANGVILITTKKGKDGETQIRLNTTYGISQLAKRYEMMNAIDFLRLNRIAYDNADREWPGEPAQGQVLTNTDWQDAFYKTGITKDINLSVSGGNKQGNHLFSLDYYDEDGVVVGPYHNRLTARSNSEARKGIFTVGENLMVGYSNTRTLNGSPFIDLARMPPVIPIYANDEHTEYGIGSTAYPTYGTNPIGAQETEITNQYNFRVIGNAFLQIEPIKGLQLKSNVGIEYFNWFDRHTSEEKQLRYLSLSTYETVLTEGNGAMQSWLWENTAFYQKSISEHNFDLLFGYTAQRKDRRGNTARGYNILEPGFWVLDQASPDDGTLPKAVSGSNSAVAMTSLLGRVNYNYANRYIFQFNVRRDGSSLFGQDYRYGTFPGVSLGWRINEEEFLKSVLWINDLKLRLSYGKSGNQAAIDPYKFATYIESGDRGIVLGNDEIFDPGQIQVSLANSNLRWETRATYNAGLEFTVLKHRLYGSIDVFHANLSALLIQKDIPWMKGTDTQVDGKDVRPWINYGKINNKGFELQLGWRETKRDFKYDVALNLTRTVNKLLELNGDDNYHFDGIGSSSYSEPGRSLGDFYVLKTDGIFQNWEEVNAHSYTDPVTGVATPIQPDAEPGDIRYADLDNDGVISYNNLSGDKYFAGSPFPAFEAGLNFNFEYKGIDLNLFFFGVYGNYIYNNTKFWLERMDETGNAPKGLNYWRGEGTSNTVPRPLMNASNNTTGASDRWLERGDYLRLKNIQIGYSLPQKWLNKTQVFEKLRVYAGAQNPFTLTGYSGLDPEISGGIIYAKGYDDGHFPPVRTFTFGLQAGF